MSASLPAMLAVMAAAALFCRMAGYMAMRFLPLSLIHISEPTRPY